MQKSNIEESANDKRWNKIVESCKDIRSILTPFISEFPNKKHPGIRRALKVLRDIEKVWVGSIWTNEGNQIHNLKEKYKATGHLDVIEFWDIITLVQSSSQVVIDIPF